MRAAGGRGSGRGSVCRATQYEAAASLWATVRRRPLCRREQQALDVERERGGGDGDAQPERGRQRGDRAARGRSIRPAPKPDQQRARAADARDKARARTGGRPQLRNVKVMAVRGGQVPVWQLLYLAGRGAAAGRCIRWHEG